MRCAFAWFANWSWVIQIAMLAFVFLLFPTGQLRSRRWRPAAWSVGTAFALAAVVLLVTATRYWSQPFIFSGGGSSSLGSKSCSHILRASAL